MLLRLRTQRSFPPKVRWFSVWGPWVPRGHLGTYAPSLGLAPPKAQTFMSLGGPWLPRGQLGPWPCALGHWAPNAKPGVVINCMVDCFIKTEKAKMISPKKEASADSSYCMECLLLGLAWERAFPGEERGSDRTFDFQNIFDVKV